MGSGCYPGSRTVGPLYEVELGLGLAVTSMRFPLSERNSEVSHRLVFAAARLRPGLRHSAAWPAPGSGGAFSAWLTACVVPCSQALEEWPGTGLFGCNIEPAAGQEL